MKLSIIPAELESGKRTRFVGEKPMLRIRTHRTEKGPFRIEPQSLNGEQVSLVWVESITPQQDGRTELKIIPIFQKAYQVIHARANSLTALTVQFPDEQVTFTERDHEKTNHRLNGAGCDPSVHPDPDALLSNLIKTSHSHPVVRQCLSYIRTKFSK